jgi:p-hydroxybenzoate 3-monooxygenase
MSVRETGVAIVGAGPAGLMLGNLLQQRGSPCIVVDKFTREQLQTRARAGLLEYRTVEALRRHGLADRLLAEAKRETGCEFRTGGRSFFVDYAALYGDRTHFVYPQQEVVTDLLAAFLDGGGEAHLGVAATRIEADEAGAAVTCADGLVVRAEIVAGADGQHGPCLASLLAGGVRGYRMEHEFRWLALLAHAPPSADWIVYAHHQRGFAGHLLRNAAVTRFYLQVAAEDCVEDWPDERVWEELRVRLAKPGWRLNEGEIFEKRLLDMASVVHEPMGAGRVVLLGDAAHIITPSGGKGMNLAIADAVELDACLAELGTGDPAALLECYSDRRLPDIWKAQEFSHALLHMIHEYDAPGEDAAFRQRLQQARLWQLANSEAYARSFAESYVGPLPALRSS